jgi:hypothetical protein
MPQTRVPHLRRSDINAPTVSGRVHRRGCVAPQRALRKLLRGPGPRPGRWRRECDLRELDEGDPGGEQEQLFGQGRRVRR